jgi:hypothetical protein
VGGLEGWLYDLLKSLYWVDLYLGCSKEIILLTVMLCVVYIILSTH